MWALKKNSDMIRFVFYKDNSGRDRFTDKISC